MARHHRVSLPVRHHAVHVLDVDRTLAHAQVRPPSRSTVAPVDTLVRRAPVPRAPIPDSVAGLVNARRHAPALPTQVRVRTRGVTNVPTLPKPRRFPVASIDLSRPDVALPYGTPQFVNVATLKRLAGGRASDALLRKTADGWEFVSPNTLIDLKDGTQEFRLGRLAIFS